MGMHYTAISESDIGTTRKINQDKLTVKHLRYKKKEVLMAIVCDGVGGLDEGETASSEVIAEFEKWFSEDLAFELKQVDMGVIGAKWSLLLREMNFRLQEYGREKGERLGTTFTGVLFVDNRYVIVHVGDTRMYYIGTSLEQWTTDQTYVAREISKGTMTLEEAKISPRRNTLLQCVGASKVLRPQILFGQAKKGVYILCSDGFRHKITEREFHAAFRYRTFLGRSTMQKKALDMIDLVKQRGEKDNISVILIKASGR